MKLSRKTAAKALGTTVGVLLYAAVLAIGAASAVAVVTWLAYRAQTTFVDVVAVLAAALYGMTVADRFIGLALRWLLKVALRAVLGRLRRMMGARDVDQDDEAAVDRVPVWLDRPPCEGTYLVQHPDGSVEHGVRVKRYLPRKGLWAILLSGLTEVDDLVDQGYRFDGPLSRSHGT